jgi:CRP-like cAMP-binding protein
MAELRWRGASLVKKNGLPGRWRGAAGENGRSLDNQLLKRLPQATIDALAPAFDIAEMARGDSLFEPGDAVTHAHFPLEAAVVSLVLPMRDGRTVEAATIGREGAVGGVISLGLAPAFTRATVQIPGRVARIPVQRLEAAKRTDPGLHALLARYADCLTAQILQSVGCAALHPLEARCARWLLTTHDRLRQAELPLTQEALAEMFGVARTYVTRITTALQDRGAIAHRRGIIRIVERALLEASACECYGLVRRHFERVLPGLYPTTEP